MSPPSVQRDAIQALVDGISEARSPEALLALLEQLVASCSEIISAILADQHSSNHTISNNEII